MTYVRDVYSESRKYGHLDNADTPVWYCPSSVLNTISLKPACEDLKVHFHMFLFCPVKGVPPSPFVRCWAFVGCQGNVVNYHLYLQSHWPHKTFCEQPWLVYIFFSTATGLEALRDVFISLADHIYKDGRE